MSHTTHLSFDNKTATIIHNSDWSGMITIIYEGKEVELPGWLLTQINKQIIAQGVAGEIGEFLRRYLNAL